MRPSRTRTRTRRKIVLSFPFVEMYVIRFADRLEHRQLYSRYSRRDQLRGTESLQPRAVRKTGSTWIIPRTGIWHWCTGNSRPVQQFRHVSSGFSSCESAKLAFLLVTLSHNNLQPWDFWLQHQVPTLAHMLSLADATHQHSRSHFRVPLESWAYTGCLKNSFTTLNSYINVFRGYVRRFELSWCSKIYRVLLRIVTVHLE
jgi:hypothetical protein